MGFYEAWRRLLMARFYDEEGRVRFDPGTPFVFGYDVINRAPLTAIPWRGTPQHCPLLFRRNFMF